MFNGGGGVLRSQFGKPHDLALVGWSMAQEDHVSEQEALGGPLSCPGVHRVEAQVWLNPQICMLPQNGRVCLPVAT